MVDFAGHGYAKCKARTQITISELEGFHRTNVLSVAQTLFFKAQHNRHTDNMKYIPSAEIYTSATVVVLK